MYHLKHLMTAKNITLCVIQYFCYFCTYCHVHFFFWPCKKNNVYHGYVYIKWQIMFLIFVCFGLMLFSCSFISPVLWPSLIVSQFMLSSYNILQSYIHNNAGPFSGTAKKLHKNQHLLGFCQFIYAYFCYAQVIVSSWYIFLSIHWFMSAMWYWQKALWTCWWELDCHYYMYLSYIYTVLFSDYFLFLTL